MVPEVVCPAAAPVAGTTPERAGVICGVMQQDRLREQGIGITPTQLAISRDGADGVLLTAKGDPSTIERLCCGEAVPVLDDAGHYARDSYTYCPVWQAEKDRLSEGRAMLGHEHEPELVAEGVSSQDADDPWGQARRDLNVLAPR